MLINATTCIICCTPEVRQVIQVVALISITLLQLIMRLTKAVPLVIAHGTNSPLSAKLVCLHVCSTIFLSTFSLLLMLCRLLPGVEDVAQNVADPECRSVASKAHATLLKVGADGKVTGIVANEAEVLAVLGSAVAKVDGQVGEVVVKYVASMMCGLINASQYKDEQWTEVSRCCLRCSLSARLPAAAAVLHRDLAVVI